MITSLRRLIWFFLHGTCAGTVVLANFCVMIAGPFNFFVCADTFSTLVLDFSSSLEMGIPRLRYQASSYPGLPDNAERRAQSLIQRRCKSAQIAPGPWPARPPTAA